MRQPPPHLTDDHIIEQAVAYARLSGWTVQHTDCQVQAEVTDELRRSGVPDTWFVSMTAQPSQNANLRAPMPLGCRIQLLEGRLCPIVLYEPSNRKSYQ